MSEEHLVKLDEEFETNATVDNQEAAELKSEQESIENNDQVSGISIENIPYLEKNISTGTEADNQSVLEERISADEQASEEYTPPLFADDNEKNLEREGADSQTEELFDQDINDEEDFEIPAFLRKQKF